MRTCEVEWKRFHYHPKDMLHARSNRHVGASFLWAMMHVMVASSKVRCAPEMSQDPVTLQPAKFDMCNQRQERFQRTPRDDRESLN